MSDTTPEGLPSPTPDPSAPQGPPPGSPQPGLPAGWPAPPPPGAATERPPYAAPYQSPTPRVDPLGSHPRPAEQGAGSAPRRTRLAAGLVAASLVAGVGGGFAGAALWDSTNDGARADSSSSAVNAGPAVHQGPAPAQGSVEQVARAVLPSVVKIDVSGAQGTGSGSGIILTTDGQILTNNHVAELAGDQGTITVFFNDGAQAPAKVLGADPLTDTAVLQAEGVSGLTAATIGRSAQLSVGQQVVAIGSPFGLDATVTSGIVSALDRPVNVGTDASGNATVYPAIQTDAAINPGNSGGPLVDMNGDVVGINSSIRTASSGAVGGEPGSIGLGFAIPIDEVMPVIAQMRNGETPTHARLGIGVSNASGDPASDNGQGAQVGDVSPGSAAAAAGLTAGDVITKIDDHVITGSDSLIATIRTYRPGDQVTVTWTHDGKERSASVRLGTDATTS